MSAAPPKNLVEMAAKHPHGVLRQRADGEWSIYPNGFLPAMLDACAEEDRKARQPRPWYALRGLLILASKLVSGVKLLLVWLLTAAFLLEVLALDYLRDLGGADPGRVDHAKRVRISARPPSRAGYIGIGGWPSIALYMCGFPLTLWLHFAAIGWLFGCTIFPS